MNTDFTETAASVLEEAYAFSLANRHGYIGTEHLLYAFLNTKADKPSVAAHLLETHGIHADAIRAQMKCIPQLPGAPTPQNTPMLDRILRRAAKEAIRFPTVPTAKDSRIPPPPAVGTEHLLFALLCETDSAAAHMMTAQNAPLHELYGDVLSFLSAVAAEQAILSDRDDTKRVSAPQSDESKETPDVIRFFTDMASGAVTPVIGREAETEQLLAILCRRQKNNPCMTGDAGVGKTAIAEGLAQRLQSGAVPEVLCGKRLFSLDLAALVAGTRYRGDFEERLRAVLRFCRESPDVILFVDEMHMLMGAGAAEGALDAANLLKPALSRGELRMIGATTTEEFRRFIERDAAMARRFQEVRIREPSPEDTYRMLCGTRAALEAHHHVILPDETLRAVITLSQRYIPDRRLPDKALDLLDDACAGKALSVSASSDMPSDRAGQRNAALLSGDLALAQKLTDRMRGISDNNRQTGAAASAIVAPVDIASVITQRNHIPVTELSQENNPMPNADTLHITLSRAVIGQEHAVLRMVDAYRRISAGLQKPERPRAAFLFHGPSGVGKTALCVAFAEAVFGHADALLRFDMAEYAEGHSVSALIGAPPGYVGYGSGGTLTEAVHRRPYALLLFDEIEKAHPDVLHLFLGMLDTGHITDSHGRSIDFSHTVIVMTTNIGGTAQQMHITGFAAPVTEASPPAHAATPVPKALFSAFPREFLNRFDGIIPFTPLTEESISAICEKQTKELARRVSEKGITLRVTPAAQAQLSALAYAESPQFGARPISRILADQVEAPLAQAMVSGKYKQGGTVTVRISHGKFIFST